MSSVNAYPGLESICVTCLHRPAVNGAAELTQQDVQPQPDTPEVNSVDDLLVPTFLGTTAASAHQSLEALGDYANDHPCRFVKDGGRCMVAEFAVSRMFNVAQGQ